MTYTVEGAARAKAKLISLCEARPEEAAMLLDALQMLQTNGPVSQDQGICGNTQYILSEHMLWDDLADAELDDWLCFVWPQWEYWTGDYCFPVPASRANRNLEDASDAYGLFEEWDVSTEYGQLRNDLLNHCIDTLQEAIDHAKD